jgi:hypothetical protein
MGMYPGPSCPDRSSHEELSAAEVDARIHKVVDLGSNPNHRVSPVPLRRGVTSARVSTLGPVSVAFKILSFHCTHDLALGLGGGCIKPQDANLPKDTAKR